MAGKNREQKRRDARSSKRGQVAPAGLRGLGANHPKSPTPPTSPPPPPAPPGPPSKPTWAERLRALAKQFRDYIRLGEWGVVIAFLLTGISSGQKVQAILLLVIGLLMSFIFTAVESGISKTTKYSIAFVVSLIFISTGVYVLALPDVALSRPVNIYPPQVSPALQPQYDELQEIAQFFGQDEWSLRNEFDIPNIFTLNIHMQKLRTDAEETGGHFYYTDHSYNGTAVCFPTKENVSIGPDGFQFKGPTYLAVCIVTTEKYQNAMNQLNKFENSPLTPDSVKRAIDQFNSAVAQNTKIMVDIFNEKLTEDKAYFETADDPNSDNSYIITNEFATKFIDLKPYGDTVISVIAKYLKTN